MDIPWQLCRTIGPLTFHSQEIIGGKTGCILIPMFISKPICLYTLIKLALSNRIKGTV